MQKILILGGNSDISYNLILYLQKKNYEITITSRNYIELKNKFKSLKNIKIQKLDLGNKKELNNFINNLKSNFCSIYCFSGVFESKNLKEIIVSNYLGIKNFINLYVARFDNASKFIIITSVAVLRKKNNNLYTKSKKKLSEFLNHKKKQKINIQIFLLGYIDTKLVKKKSFFFKILSTNRKKTALEICRISLLKQGDYVIPSYWKLIIKLYNLFNFVKF